MSEQVDGQAATAGAPLPAAEAGLQQELPLALVYGQAVTELPLDLYIPPDALEVFLEAFEGPLDLLLYLIRKQNIDILDIPVAEITKQYMGYVELMKSVRLELAAEYEASPELVRSILAEGAEKARDEARDTLVEVRQALGLVYR